MTLKYPFFRSKSSGKLPKQLSGLSEVSKNPLPSSSVGIQHYQHTDVPGVPMVE